MLIWWNQGVPQNYFLLLISLWKKKTKKCFNLKPLSFPDSSSIQHIDSSSGGERHPASALYYPDGARGPQASSWSLESSAVRQHLSQFRSFRDKVLQRVKNQCSPGNWQVPGHLQELEIWPLFCNIWLKGTSTSQTLHCQSWTSTARAAMRQDVGNYFVLMILCSDQYSTASPWTS